MAQIRYGAAAVLASVLLRPDPAGTGQAAHLEGAREVPRWTMPGEPRTVGTVTQITDGDTIWVSGVDRPVRLLGIEAPEDPCECGGADATAYATEMLQGRKVTISTDPTQRTHDRFGQLLAYAVLPDGTNFSLAAAEAGAVKAYTEKVPVEVAVEISTAETRARDGGHGMWGPPCYMS
ncbi:thermonuclease family protein [Phytohabitans kaempferiae]|uniref:Thermonuclease family protein n=1 Tax=Phytohabitans kaempferiae TaxID=1620943 RepID=A0ABV6LYG3_9ACTN